MASAEVSPYGYPEHYAVIIGGQTDPNGNNRHEESWYTWYWNLTSSMYEGLRDNYLYPADHIYFLFEEDGSGALTKDTQRIHDRDATRANVDQVLNHVRRRLDSDDVFFLFWVSHGIPTSFLLPGEDYLHTRLDTALDNFAGNLVLALQPCQSGCAISPLSQANRILLTSTNCGENNSQPWGETFRDAILGSAPGDSHGNISIASAFDYTANLIQSWTSAEHPMLEDNGDGVGSQLNDAFYDRCAPAMHGSAANILSLGHYIPN